MIHGVFNHRGKLIGVFQSTEYADRFIAGLHAQQMAVVGYVEEFVTKDLTTEEFVQLWKERILTPKS